MNISVVCSLNRLHSVVAAGAVKDNIAAVASRNQHGTEQGDELCSGSYLLGFWSCRRLNGNDIDVAVIPTLFHEAQMPLKCNNLFALQPS